MSGVRRFCEHCEETLAPRTFREHCRLFYDTNTSTWTKKMKMNSTDHEEEAASLNDQS